MLVLHNFSLEFNKRFLYIRKVLGGNKWQNTSNNSHLFSNWFNWRLKFGNFLVDLMNTNFINLIKLQIRGLEDLMANLLNWWENVQCIHAMIKNLSFLLQFVRNVIDVNTWELHQGLEHFGRTYKFFVPNWNQTIDFILLS
jgi:hypothetical protein